MGSEILIVIPCLNERTHLPGLLEWLRQDMNKAIVVVADGGSTDGSQEFVENLMHEWPALRLLDNAERIQSAGVNLAVKTYGTGHNWLIRIDAHAAYPHDYAGRLIDAAIANNADSVVVPMMTIGSSCFQRGVAAAQNSIVGTGGSPHRHLGQGAYVDHGHHALFRLQAFQSVDGYDETFSHNEDAELDLRLQASGFRIWLEPKAAVQYYPRATPSALWQQYFRFGQGRARTVRKHRTRPKLRQALPLMIAPVVFAGLISVPLSLFSGWMAVLAVPLLGWALLCLSAGIIFAFRDRRLCSFTGAFALMIMHLAWSSGFWSQFVSPNRIGR